MARSLFVGSTFALVLTLACGCSSGGEKRAATPTTGTTLENPVADRGPPPNVRHGRPRVIAAAGVTPELGADRSPPTAANGEEALDRALPAATTRAAAWVNLAAKARRAGTVRVLVQLKAPGRPEPLLRPAERLRQRAKFTSAKAALLRDLRGTPHAHVKPLPGLPFVALEAGPRTLDTLRASPEVAAVSEERTFYLPKPQPRPQATSPNDWLNLNPWWDHYRIGADTAWSKGYDGRGWVVAILDTGVETSHPWLAGKVVREACFATTDDGAGACPNGTATQYGAGAAAPCTYSETCGHGTHVAGIAAGRYGVARSAQIIAIQVFHKSDCTDLFGFGADCPSSSTSDEIRALKYVYSLRNTYNIAAVNLSLGDPEKNYAQPCDNVDADTVAFAWQAYYLRAARIATVVSSGNDGSSNGIDDPSCISQNVSVGNTTLDYSGNDAVYVGSGGSNSDQYLSLLAPGTAICSAFPASWGANDCNAGDSNHQWTGTSMAAPQVTGAIATLKQLRAAATVSAEVKALQASGVSVYDDRNGVTKPRIRVWDSLVYLYQH